MELQISWNFCVLFPLPNSEARKYAADLLARLQATALGHQPLVGSLIATLPEEFRQQPEFSDEDFGAFQYKETEDGIVMQSDHGGEIAAARFIQHLIRKYHSDEFFSFVCVGLPTPLNAYSGQFCGASAFLITAETVEQHEIVDWISEAAAKLTGKTRIWTDPQYETKPAIT